MKAIFPHVHRVVLHPLQIHDHVLSFVLHYVIVTKNLFTAEFHHVHVGLIFFEQKISRNT